MANASLLLVALNLACSLWAQQAEPVLRLDPATQAPKSPIGLLNPQLAAWQVTPGIRTSEATGAGYLLEVTGPAGAVVLRHSDRLNLSKSLTLAACVYPRAVPGDAGSVVVARSDPGDPCGYGLYLEKSGQLRFQLGSATGIVSKTPVPVGQWSYVAGVFDGAAKRAWAIVNDEVVEATVDLEALPNPASPPAGQPFLYIGGNGRPGMSLQGAMASMAIYAQALPLEALRAQAEQWRAQVSEVRFPGEPLLRFVQVTDTHLTDEGSAYLLERGVEQINDLQPRPAFVVFTGDLSDGSSVAELELFRSVVGRLRMPWYAAIGNHDMANDKRNFEQVLGPRNQAFEAGPATALVIDSTMPSEKTFGGGFTDETIEWLKKTLAQLPPDKPLLVFAHHGFCRPDNKEGGQDLFCDVDNPEALLQVLQGRKVLGIFVGHAHTNAEFDSGGTRVTVTASLSLNRANAGDFRTGAPAGFREVSVFAGHVTSRYWAVGERARPAEAVVAVVTQQPGYQFSGTDGEVIQKAIDWVYAGGGGTVVITEGTYEIARALHLCQGVSLVGKGATLFLSPMPSTKVAKEVKKGEKLIPVDDASGFCPGLLVEVQVPVGPALSTGSTCMSVRDSVLELHRPLPVDVPVGTVVDHAWNLIDIESNCQVVGLRLVGNREKSARPLVHSSHCGIFGYGQYGHDSRGAGQPIEHVRIADCEITGFHQRGIAVYGGAYVVVTGCRIVGNGAEAIDFDHYSYDCIAANNHLEDCPVGVEINDGYRCTVTGNQIVNCEMGINLWEWFTSPVMNTDNLVAGNVFERCPTGVHCGLGTDYNLIAANRFVNSGKRDFGIAGPGNGIVGNDLSLPLGLSPGATASFNQNP